MLPGMYAAAAVLLYRVDRRWVGREEARRDRGMEGRARRVGGACRRGRCARRAGGRSGRSAGRAAIVRAALSQVGWPYVWGGESRTEGGFDCSGLVDHAYARAGYPLPGRPTAAVLWAMSVPLKPAELRPGDLVFLGARSGLVHHVGLYAGGGWVIAASHRGAPVSVEPLAAVPWDGFGRILRAPRGKILTSRLVAGRDRRTAACPAAARCRPAPRSPCARSAVPEARSSQCARLAATAGRPGPSGHRCSSARPRATLECRAASGRPGCPGYAPRASPGRLLPPRRRRA